MRTENEIAFGTSRLQLAPETKQEIGTRIRMRLKELGMSQIDLAKITGLSKAVNHIIAGKQGLTVELLCTIAFALSLNASFLHPALAPYKSLAGPIARRWKTERCLALPVTARQKMGKEIRLLLTEIGMTPDDLGICIGVTKSRIQQVISAKGSYPSIPLILAIAQALEVLPSALHSSLSDLDPQPSPGA